MTGNGAQTPETRQRHGWLLAGLLAALAVTLFLLEGPLGARVVTIEPAVVLIFDGKAKKVVLAECETLLGQWRETNGTMESASTLGAYLECLEQLHYMGKISWDDYRARLKPVMTAESFAALFEGSNVQSGLKLFNRRLNRILNTRWQKVTVSNPVPAGHRVTRLVGAARGRVSGYAYASSGCISLPRCARRARNPS